MSAMSLSTASTVLGTPTTTTTTTTIVMDKITNSDRLETVTSSFPPFCKELPNDHDSFGEISVLNDRGVTLLQQGHRDEAADCFLRALWQLEHPNSSSNNNSRDHVDKKSWVAPPMMDTDNCASHTVTSSNSCWTLFPSSDIAVPSAATAAAEVVAGSRERAPMSSYIYQREDYDEGLFVYRQALSMSNTMDMPLCQQRLVILRYNMGLICIGGKHYNRARQWFQTAWDLLVQTQQQQLQQGKHIQEQEQRQDEWKHREKMNVIAEDHNLKLHLLHNLGYCCYCLGNNAEALKFYQEALAVMDCTAPTSREHPEQQSLVLDRAATYGCIAVLLFHRSSKRENDNEQALLMLQQTLQTYEALLVDGTATNDDNIHYHVRVATCLGNMGRIHFLTSDHDRAITAFRKAYHLRKEFLGDDNLDTAAMLFNLGQSLHHRGAYDTAMEAYREFLRVATAHYQHCYGNDAHRDICAVQRAMAQVHRHKGQLPEACDLLRRAFDAGSRALGPLETEVSCILSELGSLYAERNDYPSSIDCFLHFLQTQETLFNQTQPLHTNILITKINLARVYKHNLDYLSAFRYYKEVHAMQVQIVANNENNNKNNNNHNMTRATTDLAVSNLEIASTLSSMGLCLYLLQAYKLALDCYQEALRIRLEKLGTSQHADVVETINSIGLVLFKLGMMEMAKEAFHECILIRSKLLLLQQDNAGSTTAVRNGRASSNVSLGSSSSKEIAILLFNMATACMKNGEEEQAIEWYCESLRVERRVLGNDHPDVSMTLQHLGRVHEELGDFPMAIDYFQEALEISRKQTVGTDVVAINKSYRNKDCCNNEENVVRVLRVLGNLHFMLGHVQETMACFSEASRLEQQQGGASADTPLGIEVVSRTGANFYGLSRLHPPGAPAA